MAVQKGLLSGVLVRFKYPTNSKMVNKDKQKNGQNGFTLIEMIVSIAIFIVVALIAVGALLKVIDANHKSQSLKTSINNLNYALEAMSRELRVGTRYHCEIDYTSSSGDSLPAQPCGWTSFSSANTGTQWQITFKTSHIVTGGAGGCPSSYPLIFAYRFNNGTIEKAEKKACNDVINGGGNIAFYPVISPDIHFDLATVKVVAGDSSKTSYAQFRFKGYSGLKEKTKTYFDLQTTVSQRLPD